MRPNMALRLKSLTHAELERAYRAAAAEKTRTTKMVPEKEARLFDTKLVEAGGITLRQKG